MNATQPTRHIVIIGNGISGITTARHVRKMSKHKITVISGETDHFFSRTALMYIFMGHMQYGHTKPYEDWFWAKNDIALKRAWVKHIDFASKTLHFEQGEAMPYDQLVLALGSKSNKFGWPGQDLQAVQGLYSYQDLEGMEKYAATTQRAVVVGGGLIGVEMAEMWLTRGVPVTFLVREDRFWGNVLPREEGELVARHLKEHHVDLRFETELKEILPDAQGRARAIITAKGEEIPCQFVGLTAGVSPNVDFLKNTALEIQRGIMVNEYLETNIPEVYALGDCVQRQVPAPGRRPIEQVWYTGRMMGEVLAKTLCGQKTVYQPGPWFNSAKFFDIEYQTYGQVANELPPDENTFYWEAVNGRICLRLNYERASGKVRGLNVFGMRHRHEVWDAWLKEEKTVDEVMTLLPQANFDPEFFRPYESEILAQYNRETGKQLRLKARKGLWQKLFV
ncbi:MAG: FAD-dependent oxidoreductase [Microscillaceae bacterium]|nr:FAD-dependent oxidoreductase [Microscillaceae bacterium]